MLQALLSVASRMPGDFRPLAPMLAEARRIVGSSRPLDGDKSERVGTFVLRAAAQGQVHLSLGDRPDPPEAPPAKGETGS